MVRTRVDGRSRVYGDYQRRGFYCLKKPGKGNNIDVITGMKAEGVWPTLNKFVNKANWDAIVQRSPQASLGDDLQQNVWTKLPNDIPGLKGDQFVIDCIQRILAAEKVDPCSRLVNVRKFFLIGRGDDTFRSSVSAYQRPKNSIRSLTVLTAYPT